jgi:hypothetical protein
MRLDFLRPLHESPGDYASLYLDASRTTEDAAGQITRSHGSPGTAGLPGAGRVPGCSGGSAQA